MILANFGTLIECGKY